MFLQIHVVSLDKGINKFRKRLAYMWLGYLDNVPLSVRLLACTCIWTSLNALGSCCCQPTSYGEDNCPTYTLVCPLTNPNALGSCCYPIRSSRKVTIKRIMANNNENNIDMEYPVGIREIITTDIYPPVSQDALCASSKADIHPISHSTI